MFPPPGWSDLCPFVSGRGRCYNAVNLAGMPGLTKASPITVPYVITEPCIGTKDAACVEVCPVDCIHSDDSHPQYYINPDECIDCGACEPVCPVSAIFPEDAVPEEWKHFVESNAGFYKG